MRLIELAEALMVWRLLKPRPRRPVPFAPLRVTPNSPAVGMMIGWVVFWLAMFLLVIGIFWGPYFLHWIWKTIVDIVTMPRQIRW